ncbi:MAG: carbohydrate kinase family protein [Candidatus Sungbacteria bacterium]|uniref:Carbohydrate kinase family protein n=1 Tax=Candidatus Sungiibacteriota bacterium TaxID=2750080 RepID=A0A932VR21_9BACT|nr:carbohydrate kinase family protein [Candidatus Sungbacteria bacterium]
MNRAYDFIAIGDTVTDAFIRLKEAEVHCDINKERCMICMRFADKIPYESVTVVPAVGNSANAAVSAARLGLSGALVANIGDDYFGKECLAALEGERVGTEFIKVNAGYKTNYHYVLWYDADRTILVKHEEYPYALPDIGEPRWVYLSSVGENGLALHAQIEIYLVAHPNIKLAFQPGTYQMKFGRKKLAGVYRRTEAFFCNKEEAQRILETKEEDVKTLMGMMADLGPKIVAITDGPNGAYAFDGATAWFMPLYPDPKPPLQRTGAGDAFSSTFTVALALGRSVSEALTWGPINSMSVVQGIGAREGLLTMPQLQDYLKNAPSFYKPRVI